MKNFIPEKYHRLTTLTHIFLFLFVYIFILSCNNTPKEPDKINTDDYKAPLLIANEHMVKVENEEINNYIKRYEWDMQTTATGLRYMIYKKGNGKPVNMGDKVKINYKVKLITGVVCYTSDDDGALEFLTGKAEVINGLEEAVLLMHEGDRAKVIIPSHLAYGLLGDEEKIPKRATLIYDIELLKEF